MGPMGKKKKINANPLAFFPKTKLLPSIYKIFRQRVLWVDLIHTKHYSFLTCYVTHQPRPLVTLKNNPYSQSDLHVIIEYFDVFRSLYDTILV